MFVPAIAMRLAPYVGGVLLLIVVRAWGYGDGRDTEREKWQVEMAAAQAKLREREIEWQKKSDAADAALATSNAVIDRLMKVSHKETKVFYANNPSSNVVCLTPDRLRSVEEGDARLQALSASSTGAQ